MDQIQNFSFDELLVVIWAACSTQAQVDTFASRNFQDSRPLCCQDDGVQRAFQKELAERLANFDAALHLVSD